MLKFSQKNETFCIEKKYKGVKSLHKKSFFFVC